MEILKHVILSNEKDQGITKDITNKYPTLNSLLITKNDQMLYENYFNGYTVTETQHLASVTKSIISLLVGISIDKGLIRSVEDKLLDYFPEYGAHATFIQKSISIKQLLTMTVPIAFSLRSITERPFEPLDRLRRQKDWVKFIISLIGKGNQSNGFQYSTPSTHLLSALITKTSGMSTRDFANLNLFSKIGIDEIQAIQMHSFKLEDLFGETLIGWVNDPNGINTGGWGISLKPRDMIKIGQMMLQKGQYDGRQIISEKWIETCSKEQVEGAEYSYLWWVKEVLGLKAFAALGYGGNIICCIPALDMVVVTTGKMTSKQIEPWALIESVIVSFDNSLI